MFHLHTTKQLVKGSQECAQMWSSVNTSIYFMSLFYVFDIRVFPFKKKRDSMSIGQKGRCCKKIKIIFSLILIRKIFFS